MISVHISYVYCQNVSELAIEMNMVVDLFEGFEHDTAGLKTSSTGDKTCSYHSLEQRVENV